MITRLKGGNALSLSLEQSPANQQISKELAKMQTKTTTMSGAISSLDTSSQVLMRKIDQKSIEVASLKRETIAHTEEVGKISTAVAGLEEKASVIPHMQTQLNASKEDVELLMQQQTALDEIVQALLDALQTT